ncbi:hypothetical protein JTE90_026360 [Oedothorax gibbosus]|uniref:Uncharacterized protein n=1 Tax=Oedothorax gibbosus TaxID=931172 RepID=A0AAV6UJY7_9ARAC|nr:hypothetical protein JTE90_026360 [Oedothorax gibbosus]
MNDENNGEVLGDRSAPYNPITSAGARPTTYLPRSRYHAFHSAPLLIFHHLAAKLVWTKLSPASSDHGP